MEHATHTLPAVIALVSLLGAPVAHGEHLAAHGPIANLDMSGFGTDHQTVSAPEVVALPEIEKPKRPPHVHL